MSFQTNIPHIGCNELIMLRLYQNEHCYSPVCTVSRQDRLIIKVAIAASMISAEHIREMWAQYCQDWSLGIDFLHQDLACQMSDRISICTVHCHNIS